MARLKIGPPKLCRSGFPLWCLLQPPKRGTNSKKEVPPFWVLWAGSLAGVACERETKRPSANLLGSCLLLHKVWRLGMGGVFASQT